MRSNGRSRLLPNELKPSIAQNGIVSKLGEGGMGGVSVPPKPNSEAAIDPADGDEPDSESPDMRCPSCPVGKPEVILLTV
jgi:hypothetical protein